MLEEMCDVCICVMPFCPVRAPNLGASLIKSALEKQGFSSSIFYFNLKMLKDIGIEIYDRINGEDLILQRLVGELIFSEHLFGKFADINNNVKDIITECLDLDIENIIEEIQKVKNLVPTFIDECTNEILLKQPKLVGFSTSYYQNCSSLCLAKKIKEKNNIPVIFGGANCEEEMGQALLNFFPQIDYVCSGDGDIAFITLVKCLLENKEIQSKINGILTRGSTPLEVSFTNPVMNMDELPMPNFDDYFKIVNSINEYLDIKIDMETSRGCWWGEMSHCTFCGLNGSTMKYRSKSPERVINEMEDIISKYKIKAFQFVDNILDPSYFQYLFPEITKKRMEVWMFYETKANLSRGQLTCMKNAGVAAIQPGIESLSNIILEIMLKGTTALQNIYLLKLCREIGIWPYWNIIIGFPQEPINEYCRMIKMIPFLVHLNPPETFGKFQLSRFSPYFKKPNEYGIINIRALRIYDLIYPFDQSKLNKIAYFFEHDYNDGRDVSSYTIDLEHWIKEWKRLWQHGLPPELVMAQLKDMMIIKDTRPSSTQETHILTREEAKVYDICERPQNIDTIYGNMYREYSKITREDIISILSDLCDKKILLEYDNQYLSLAIPITK
jgi:ribosomal peptide maturation radical SAM protein 1